MPLSPGQLIANRYRVIRILGKGGYGAVYLVDDTRLAGRTVALKESFDNSAEAKTQFKLEADILATIVHAALPRVTDTFVEPNGHQFIVMDFIEGEDLSTLIQRGAVPEAQAITWLTEICDAVGFLHSQNPPIIHRDIKPGNIKIRKDGHAVLVDFGIAKHYIPQKHTARIAKAISSGFSPPEQYSSTTDARSDVYALGATLYCAVTASVPPESMELLTGTANLPKPRQLNPKISPTLERIILQAMALDSQGRFATGREMAQALQACARGAQPASLPIVPSVPVSGSTKPCPTCGRPNRATAKFCQYDRTPLTSAPVPKPSMPAQPNIAPRVHFEMGNAFLRKKDFQRAIAEYAEASRGGFDHVALYNNWGNALVEIDRTDEAIPILQRGLGRYPQDADLYGNLGLAYAKNGQNQQAIIVLQRALALNPQPETHFILGLIYQQLHEDNKAIEQFRKFLAAEENSVAGRLLLAQTLFHAHQLAEAASECQRILQLDNANAPAYTLLAAIHLQNKRYNDALTAAQKSNRLAPSSLACFLMGRAYMELKKMNEAVAAFKEAVQHDPQDADAHAFLALCYALTQRRADARTEVKRALAIDPQQPIAKQLEQNL